MKKRLTLIFILALALGFSGCGKPLRKANYDIVVASDLHYITKSINDNGKYFTDMMEDADGKISIYCEEITDAFFSEVKEMRPEALILTGDITFSGRRASHEDLAKKLAEVERCGIQVLVLPGNHDVYSSQAAIFHGDGYTRVWGIETQDFRDIYADFGYNEATEQDSATASYIYRLNDDTMVLMLDMNTPEDWCSLPRSTLQWVEKVLKQAKKDGYSVLACGHQNLTKHTHFSAGYVVLCAEQLTDILHKYGVELFFSGHLHMQHIAQINGITEIASSSLSVNPCQYGIAVAKDGKIDYHTKVVDVARWAEEKGLTDENLLNWTEYAQWYMDHIAEKQIYQRLYGRGLTQEEKEPLARFYIAANSMYFRGDMTDFDSIDPDGSIRERWLSIDSMRNKYIDAITNDAGKNSTVWKNY